MIALAPASEKLRARAVRNVAALGGVGAREARRLLEECGWSVREALARTREGAPRSGGRGEAPHRGDLASTAKAGARGHGPRAAGVRAPTACRAAAARPVRL